ncbi:MAG: HupU protein [Thiomicrorhabdus sp.]|nr:HupU protein [Thiomicrorhabdus sp.]
MNILWLQSGGCSGCTLSFMGLEEQDLLSWSNMLDLNWLWHPSLTENSAQETQTMVQKVLNNEIILDIFCLEGSVIMGPNGTGRFHMLSGFNVPAKELILQLSQKAGYVLAIGTCAAYGGITAAGNNLVEATGLQYDQNQFGSLLPKHFRSAMQLPVINISGCPVHPAWVAETIGLIALNQFTESSMDSVGRPLFYANKLVHHGCSRNEYYEYKASAQKPSDLGCMMENMGCIGTIAHADCNERGWHGNSSCTKGGYACIDCTSPDFGRVKHAYQSTPKIGNIPVGLPTDMPKAWFIALSTLSKSATPKRIKENAVQDHIVISPEIKQTKR